MHVLSNYHPTAANGIFVFMQYSEKLRDPRWQKKRLEIMSRDEFSCFFCGDGSTTLNVHHLSYGQEPWDVPNSHLITVCETCHNEEHKSRPLSESKLIQSLKTSKFSHTDIDALADGFDSIKMLHLPCVIASSLNWALSNESAMKYILESYFNSIKQKESPFEKPF